ncbi:MAG: Asp-tRNA(Asn)/Glu-tRNA(Gln) amidotransferase subunit GatB [Gammaproteobacteria bacterium]
MQWQAVIGLELHAQLATKSKIFSGAATAFGAAPNRQACAIDLGLPGVLPVLNAEAVRMAVKFGLAIEATIARRSVFARKNYFYPDLPKGYQISQYERPIVAGGHIDIDMEDGTTKVIDITRAHLEEDAGKSLHEDFHGFSGIDLNRAGTPLLEIVSEPQLHSAREAVAYMKKMHTLLRYLEICDGNMEQGSLRCDANISVRPRGDSTLGTRTELKNLNSFRFVERAINYEIERHITLLEDGGQVVQETRLYDPDSHATRSMRSKEEANDYRYFPDPDLLPLALDEALIESVRQHLPELPDAKKQRFETQYGLSPYDAGILTATRELADFFESTVVAAGGEAKRAANWVIGDLAGALNKSGKSLIESPVSPTMLGGMIRRIADGTISGKIAKAIFEAMWEGQGDADTLIERQGLRQVSDESTIERIIDEVMVAHPEQVQGYRAGKHKLLSFFVGQVMKLSKGKANPKQVNERLKCRLEGGD